jgi:hypothetical protein
VKAIPKKVNYFTNDCDKQCALYGAMGLSTAFIMEKTGLSLCQVNYRLQKARIKRADYRNGGSVFVKSVIQNSSYEVNFQLKEHLRRVLG